MSGLTVSVPPRATAQETQTVWENAEA